MEHLEKMKRRLVRPSNTDMFPSLHPEITTRLRFAERRFERVLIAGFSFVLLLMLASAAVAITEMRRLEQGTAQMSGRYLAQARLVEELERQQGAVGILLYNMGDVSGPAAAQVHRTEAGLRRQAVRSLVADSVRGGLPAPEVQAWSAIGAAAQALFDEIDLLLSQGRGNSPALSERLSAFMAQSARVIDLSYSDVSADRKQELDRDSGIIRGSTTVMAGALSLAILCAVLCVVGAITGFRGIEKQAEALGRLSVHTFAAQEESARRFSQEMHDEFGQTLNAIESTLTAVEAKNPAHQERVRDAVVLAKEAQALARDMSQLMRPRILDDFGLDAGLRELAQGFSRRSGISVDYRGDFRDRLDPSVETHLFRIAQEALTNSARHSEASNIELSLLRENTRGGPVLRLRIADNGGGLKKEASGSGLGMLGMRERARAAGGVLSVSEVSHDFKQGVEISVQVPFPQTNETGAAA